MKRWLSRVLFVVGCLLIGLGLSYGGLVRYLVWQESSSPSTRQVLVLKDGRQIPLIQPTTAPPILVPTPIPAISAAPPGVAAPAQALVPLLTVTPPPAPAAPGDVPPLRLVIPAIGVEWPVVLADNDHMPRFKGVGWLMGSAFPGAPGNLVLFGHLDGPYATFGRLRELAAGDEVDVITEASTARYQVVESREVLPDAVEVLAPTAAATLTLITCSGDWDKLDRMYDHRLVVSAVYLGH